MIVRTFVLVIPKVILHFIPKHLHFLVWLILLSICIWLVNGGPSKLWDEDIEGIRDTKLRLRLKTIKTFNSNLWLPGRDLTSIYVLDVQV